MNKHFRRIKKLKALMKKPKVSAKDLDKIGSTITEIRECPYCHTLKEEIKMCMESHNVKNNLKSITWHNIKCEDCRTRVQRIAECKKRGHNID